AGLDAAALGPTLLIAIPPVERRSDGREEHLVLERLFEKVDGAKSHRLHGERDISMSRDDDHRHRELELSQSSQQVDTAKLGHPHVGDDAACFDRGRNLQEQGGGCVRRPSMPAEPSWKASASRTASSSSITWTMDLSAGIAEILSGRGSQREAKDRSTAGIGLHRDLSTVGL